MSATEQIEKDRAIETENAREGYQAAISLWTYQGTLNWNRFNVMLTANSIVFAVIGIAYTSQRPLPVIWLGRFGVAVFPLIGLGLCIGWFFLTVRGYEWHKYWALSALELEQRYLRDPVHTVSRSRAFGDGKSVSLQIDDKPFDLRMRWWARVASSQKWVTYVVIIVFAVVYMIVWARFTI